MKRMIIALGLIAFTYSGAQAQTSCTSTSKHTTAKRTNVKHNYAQNFKVCKDQYGYVICGEKRNGLNSTNNGLAMRAKQNRPAYYENNNQSVVYQQNEEARDAYVDNTNYQGTTPAAMIAPQNQSYPATTFTINNTRSFEGYYPKKSNIVVTYDNATAPYEGEPSPQYDGPAKNKQRNINVNSKYQNSSDPAMQLPPSGGNVR